MKPHLSPLLAVLTLLTATTQAEPRLYSWFTDKSGQYARIYPTTAAETAGNSVTTWNRGDGVQTSPTYAGIHEISHTTNWIYLRSTNLASHIMGPWLNAGGGLFPNYPANAEVVYRLPMNPADPATITSKTLTGGGPIGYFVNGVAMFDTRDAFSYDTGTMADQRPQNGGDGAWNRDAYVNEGVTFDKGNAHQAGLRYHYHANPPGLRNELGDSVDFTAPNSYTENFNGQHSPILAWVRDGIPVYGPYGYSHPTNPDSAVRRMISGFQARTDIATNGSARNTWPAWATRIYSGIQTFSNGPNVSAGFPLGRYMEDNDYKGDLGLTLYTETIANSAAFNSGTHFDLNEFNARWCVTPEYPNGTWAYFVCIAANGTPVFPYNIGRAYFGDPVGNVPNGIPDSSDSDPLTLYFEGGPELEPEMRNLAVNNGSGDVTVVWDGIENGTYEVLGSTDMAGWTVLNPTVTAGGITPGFGHTGIANSERNYFYKVNKTAVAPFDDRGFEYDTFYVDGPTDQNLNLGGGSQTVVIHLNPADAANIPASMSTNPASILVGGQAAAFVERLSRFVLVATIDPDTAGLTEGNHNMSVDFGTGAATAVNVAVVAAAAATDNILLMIVDDWAVDSSPIDNNTTLNPGTTFPTMANLQALAAGGVRFTNGYTQPVCSPMRAAIMTGRQAWRTGVGNPGDPLLAAETTLPEAFANAGSDYALASFGKWHLGGGNTGANVIGGWPHFVGITGGGVQDYFSWPKNDNGSVTQNFATYTTTDQVNEALSFIDTQETAGKPWFIWMAFNAPHTPFHEPPAALLQGGTGAGNRALYEKMLEALDTEIGRLLAGIDQTKTNIFLVGDNGTPNQVVQAPYGPSGAGGAAHAKGDIYEGGIHVPFVAKGPAVTLTGGTTSNRFVHVIDLFPTILELAGINPPATAADATSLVPVLNGTDTLNRCVVTEKFADPNTAGNGDGRSIRMEADPAFPGSNPDYKLIIFGHPFDTTDTPVHEFYNIVTDQNEQSPLNLASLNPTEQAAYDALVAKEATMGGGYRDVPVGNPNLVTLYFELMSTNGAGQNFPQLVNQNNGNPVHPNAITVGGVAATSWDTGLIGPNPASRVDTTDTSSRFWIKFVFDPVAAGFDQPGQAGPHTVTVTFPGMGGGRAFDAINSYTYVP
ncbi:MAG: sulfatase-like hydrolase/transferase [Verrucomicrobiota bacterium]